MKKESTPHLLNGRWRAGRGETFASRAPATGAVVWEGAAADAEEVGEAVAAARGAAADWAVRPLAEREAVLESFAAGLEQDREAFAQALSTETGKPPWEARAEVDAMKDKVRYSLEAYRERRAEAVDGNSATRYKPHGVAAVFGPFNLPGHLPNAHLAPALLAGNTVVFKPSERTPAVGARLARLWTEAGLPPGVFNLLQGGRPTGTALAGHPDLDAIYFTGGFAGGMAIARARVTTPRVIVALELGGNNPLVVWEPCEIEAAVYHTVVSAFVGAGQRCTCARRLVLDSGSFGDRFLTRLVEVAGRLRVGPPDLEPEPFHGPVISPETATELLEAQESLLRRGALPLLPARLVAPGGALLSPGVLDVTAVPDREDREWFGPLLQVVRVPDFSAALAEANATAFGLSAGLFCGDRDRWEAFFRSIRAGVINWNRPTTGASGAQPFGGVGHSGNHRPSGYFAADYCSYPVASTEDASLSLPERLAPGVRL